MCATRFDTASTQGLPVHMVSWSIFMFWEPGRGNDVGTFSRQLDSLPIADQPSEDHLETLFVISCTVRLFISFRNCGFAIKAATSPEFTARMTSGSSRIFWNSGSFTRERILSMISLSFIIFC